MLIERAKGASEPGLDWVSVRLYNYNRKCERRRNKNEAEKEEVNSRVDISAHSAHPSLHFQQLRRLEQQQKSLQGEREMNSHDCYENNCKLPKNLEFRIYFKYLKVGGHCLKQIIRFGLWLRGILTKLLAELPVQICWG